MQGNELGLNARLKHHFGNILITHKPPVEVFNLAKRTIGPTHPLVVSDEDLGDISKHVLRGVLVEPQIIQINADFQCEGSLGDVAHALLEVARPEEFVGFLITPDADKGVNLVLFDVGAGLHHEAVAVDGCLEKLVIFPARREPDLQVLVVDPEQADR
ncbi:hypothetical protein D9M70_462320 [compost metagenome]